MIYDVKISKGEHKTFFTIDDCETLKEAFERIDELTDNTDNRSGVTIEINVR